MMMIAKVIESLARNMAIIGCGAASAFGGYQAKEPKNIFKK